MFKYFISREFLVTIENNRVKRSISCSAVYKITIRMKRNLISYSVHPITIPYASSLIPLLANHVNHALIISLANYVQGFIQKILGNRSNLPFLPLVEEWSITNTFFFCQDSCSPWDSDGLRPRILEVRRLYVQFAFKGRH